MRIVVTGSSGLIGTALVGELRAEGVEVTRLVRRAPRAPDEARWDPAGRQLDPAVLSGADAVIHLAGAGIGDHRWTAAYRATLVDSRVGGTATVAQAIAAAERPPRVLLSGSAVGWYGDRGDQVVTEDDPAGSGFLADLCREWEARTAPAASAGTRVVLLRTGLVCAPNGGLLGRLAPLFRLGLGGRMGSGRQYWPWISLRDQLAATRFLLATDAISGPVNLTGPEPVTNAEFTRALSRVLRRPALFPVPAAALTTVLGDFAREGILAGQRCLPAVLTRHGFAFTDRTVDAALRYALGR